MALAALVTACGSREAGPAAPPTAASSSPRCALRLVGGRILVDGEPVARKTAIERCTRYGEAVVYLEDESLRSEWSVIEEAFQRSRVRFYVSGPTGGTVNFGQPRRIRVIEPVSAPKEETKKVPVTPLP